MVTGNIFILTAPFRDPKKYLNSRSLLVVGRGFVPLLGSGIYIERDARGAFNVQKSVCRASQPTEISFKRDAVMLCMHLSSAKFVATSGQWTLSFLSICAETQTQSL